MSVTKLLGDLRKKLTGATTALHDEIARLRGEIDDKRAALDNARRAPLPVEEIRAERIPRLVEEHARAWLDGNGTSLVYGERSLGAPTPRGYISLPWIPSEPLPWGALCAADPDQAAGIIANLVRQVAYEAGPPSAERPALIEKLERELAELEQVEEQIIDEAVGSGVTIAHRPEVLERRTREARQRQREAEAVAARAAHEQAINAAHEQARHRGRSVASSYLTRERNR